jgi:hypothetical protein
VAIMAGRDVARVHDRWLSQSLAEYRGSRSAWDLEATTVELRLKLDQYDQTLRETADRLIALIPSLVELNAFTTSEPRETQQPRRARRA